MQLEHKKKAIVGAWTAALTDYVYEMITGPRPR
jgi:hypothetical protein